MPKLCLGEAAPPHVFEFCENGAKATIWELTQKRATPEFFADHALRELEGWSDHALEAAGRLTDPLRYDAASDRYLPVPWLAAFTEIGARLCSFAPNSTVFYASGRAGLEAAYMYQLLARLYGTNNLPDCSNMCHETTSVALPESIGVPVGTVTLDDFAHADCALLLRTKRRQQQPKNAPRPAGCAKPRRAHCLVQSTA